MAKRFIDTEIFRKDFIRGLDAPYKLLWIYILNDCNHAGIWEVEIEIAELRLGLKFNEPPQKIFKEKIIEISSTKWFIPSFIEFQYGELNPSNRAHNSVIQILKKQNLIETNEGLIKPLISPLQGAMDMDMDMVKDMVKDKEGQKQKTELDFSFLDKSENKPFKEVFREWWVYRVKEKKKPFKTQITLQKAFNYMVELSGNNPETAKKIVNQSIANTWQGLQPYKNGNENTKGNINGTNGHSTFNSNNGGLASGGRGTNSDTGRGNYKHQIVIHGVSKEGDANT